MSDQTFRVEITARTIFFTISIILVLWFAWIIRDIFIMLFTAFILMSALRPMVDKIEKLRVPRIIAALFVILIFTGFFISFIVYALPPLIIQTKDFVIFMYGQFIQLLDQYGKGVTAQNLIQINSLPQFIPNVTTIVTKTIVGIFGNLLAVTSLLFFTLYLLLDIKNVQNFFSKYLTPGQTKLVLGIMQEVEKKLGSWVRGEFILMLIIGLMSYIGLTLLGIEYALPLAIIAGLLELFPIIGPVISAIPAIIIGASSSWFLALTALALYIIIQQLENNLIVPVVMRQSVGIPRLAVLIALLVGEKFAGFTGVILAVPFTASISILIQEFYHFKTQQNVSKQNNLDKNETS